MRCSTSGSTPRPCTRSALVSDVEAHAPSNVSSDQVSESEQVDASKARRSLRNGFITLVLAVALAVGLLLGLPGPKNPLLSILPAAVGAIVLALFLLLPRYVDRILRRVEPGRLHTFLTATAASVRDTERLMFHPDWRIIGAIGYLWFDIAVLFACFAAAGHVPPLAPVVLAYQIGYLSNFIPVPGGIGILDGSLIGMLILYGIGGTIATAATLVYHAISLWIPAVWGTIAFIILQKTKKQPITLRNPTEELHPR